MIQINVLETAIVAHNDHENCKIKVKIIYFELPHFFFHFLKNDRKGDKKIAFFYQF